MCSANLTTINKAILYVKNNEQTHNVCIIHATDREEHLPPKLRENVRLLDSIYPKLRIDLVVVRRFACMVPQRVRLTTPLLSQVYAEFGPKLIKWLAKELGIPTNMVRCLALDWHVGTPSHHASCRCSSRALTRSSRSSSTPWVVCV